MKFVPRFCRLGLVKQEEQILKKASGLSQWVELIFHGSLTFYNLNKVQVFWEGYKNLKKSPTLSLRFKKSGSFFFKMFGLLWMSELYLHFQKHFHKWLSEAICSKNYFTIITKSCRNYFQIPNGKIRWLWNSSRIPLPSATMF